MTFQMISRMTIVCLLQASIVSAEDVAPWQTLPPNSQAIAVSPQGTSMQSGEWNYLVAPQQSENVELSTTVTIESPATRFDFFGSSWSAWPDPAFGDKGFEAGLLLRADEKGSCGYRVQISSKYQQVALVRFPDGGYLRSVPCDVKTGTPINLRARIAGSVLRVFVDEKELIRYVDRLEPPLAAGRVGIGASSAAKVRFGTPQVKTVEAETTPPPQSPAVRLVARSWLGGRTWVFDGDEPILQLHSTDDPSCFAKLKPGYKPQLTFDSHWGLENQGAFPDAASRWTAPSVSGGGDTLRATWSARHAKDRFATRSTLTVGFDSQRGTYTYDIESELEVLAGEPFLFRYGFDFEHHTPLDPFRWQYLLIRGRDGNLTYRPLSPFDPGPLDDIETYYGLRVWHGRTGDAHHVSPAVEYHIRPEWLEIPQDNGNQPTRPLNTAVCAAFYDTGVAFAPATAKPGDKIRVQYRYTGYSANETRELMASARVQDNPRIDPHHHFIFARDQWPTIRFDDALAMDKPWWGGRPFLTGHNARPTYEFVKQGDQGLMRLGPVSYALAPVGPDRVPPGRYVISARIKSVNAHGPGGRIELLMLKKADLAGNGFVRMDSGNILGEQIRFLGNGTFDWREVSFVAEVPAEATGLALGLGNAGTGEIQVSQVRIEPLGDQQPPAETLSLTPPSAEVPQGALWDLRMREQQGLHVYNHGSSTYRTLELANIDWVEDNGRSAIRFSENPVGRAHFPLLGILDQNLRHPVYRQNYQPMSHGAFAIGGHHGGGESLSGLTLAAWVKPSAQMGKSHHGGKGDIIGYGARRFILGLQGQQAPYSLVARINVNDRIDSQASLEAERWYHVAMTCEPAGAHWQVRLYLDGQEVGSGTTKNFPASSTIPDSLILGAELFYLHDAYYRGLMSDVLVLARSVRGEELRTLMSPGSR